MMVTIWLTTGFRGVVGGAPGSSAALDTEWPSSSTAYLDLAGFH